MRGAWILCLAAGVAHADEPARVDAAERLEVAVGETVERDVGIAVGLRCDDLSFTRIELRTVTPEANRFAVTGVAPGTTRCRVGTALNRPSFVFEIHVVPPRR